MNVVHRRVLNFLRRHWLIACAVVIGAALRVTVQLAYWPALLYIDSPRYLYGESAFDPLGYVALLWPLDRLGGLGLVTVAQHLLGLAMAVAIYAVALRRGARRFVGALAAVPLLLDAYQLQVEQNIMADTMFEAMIVAGLAALLWQARPGIRAIALAGLALGAAALVREVGLVLAAPAVGYVWLTSRTGPDRASGGRVAIGRATVLCGAFALPVASYLGVNFAVTGQVQLAGGGSDLYGRAAAAANCATLRIPSYERSLCPAPSTVRALGVDGLIHNPVSPRLTFAAPRGMNARVLRGEFTHAIFRQQPLAVAAAIARDIGSSFSYPRNADEADTAISRWQFQTSYPAFAPSLTLAHEARIIRHFGDGPPDVVRPLATALRAYQLHGGYTPGPVLALAGLAGAAGMAGAAGLAGAGGAGGAGGTRHRKNRKPNRRTPNRAAGKPPDAASRAASRAACFLVTVTGMLVLLGADVIEFSWRYQLPGLVMLPLAGALGLTALTRQARPQATDKPATEPAAEPRAWSGRAAATADADPDRAAQVRAPDLVR